MSTCRDIRPLLLEAEPQELAGEGTSQVAGHVQACEACNALARTILEETAALDRFLSHAGSSPDVDSILTGAEALGTATQAEVKVIPFPRWRRWSAVAVAAAVAGLFFLRSDAPMQVADLPSLEGAPLVETAPNQNVAVLSTANPDITVLWFF